MAVCLWAAPGASAAMVTVGNTSTFLPSSDSNNGSDTTYANFVLTENGDQVASPVNGTIVQWHVTTTGVGQYVLRVLRPAGSQYTGVGSSPGAVTTAGANSFTANLPIETGDLIGVDVPDGQGIALGLVPGASYGAFVPPIGGTATGPNNTNTNMDIGLNAEVQYPDPAPPASPGTTKKKCKKKKHKRSASAAKKCKKKKK